MSAINMDLDKRFKFDFKRKIIIGGKTYNVVFNDDVDKTLMNLELEMADYYDRVNKSASQFENEMTLDQRKQYVQEQRTEIVKDVEKTLDVILGKQGAGKAIYDYYDRQFYALAKTIEVLRETKDKLDGTAQLRKRQEHDARTAQYTQRKKRVKKHAVVNKQS